MNNIVKIINSINDDIYNSSPNFVESYGCYCEVSSNGLQTIIKFLDIVIWDEDNDSREFNEELNEYEPLEPYLRKMINYIIKRISTIEV